MRTDPGYVLHHAPDNASLVVRLALLELGVPFATRLVDRRTRQQDSDAFRALNPVGVIPVLETPHGALSETAAILLWLSERHGALAPPVGDAARGAFLKWLFFTSNTVHAELRLVFYPEQHVGDDPTAQRALHAGATARLRRHLALLDDQARAGHDWLGGDALSVLDLYLGPLLRWSALYARHGTGWFRLDDYPALAQLARGLERRASVFEAAQAEGLGETPFSAPRPCTPPQGSAT